MWRLQHRARQFQAKSGDPCSRSPHLEVPAEVLPLGPQPGDVLQGSSQLQPDPLQGKRQRQPVSSARVGPARPGRGPDLPPWHPPGRALLPSVTMAVAAFCRLEAELPTAKMAPGGATWHRPERERGRMGRLGGRNGERCGDGAGAVREGRGLSRKDRGQRRESLREGLGRGLEVSAC